MQLLLVSICPMGEVRKIDPWSALQVFEACLEPAGFE
jgi:hypothetical protein